MLPLANTRQLASPALSLLEMTMLATAVAGLLYFGYFQLAPWIWSQNVPYDPEEFTAWTNHALRERDGVELYALYALMFLNLFFAYALSCGWGRLAGGPIRYLLALPLLAVAYVFICAIGFYPPMSTLADRATQDIFVRALTVMAVILPVIALLYYLQTRSTFWSLAVAGLLLIPVCYIASAPISWFDYQFILAPALRLLHGANVSEIYFQYDLLLSLIGLAWMKLRLDLNLFQVVGQSGYYLLLLGLFAFSRRWFMDKRLPVFLLVALVLVRMYAGPYDAVYFFQGTPLRLDMCLILLPLVYFKGPHHWSAGLYCGLMLLLHHNLGIIYSAAYLQLLLTLCIIDTPMLSCGIAKAASNALGDFARKNYRNIAIILIGAMAHYLLFRNPDIRGDINIVSMRLDFTKISTHSFYWYVVLVVGLSFMLLLKLRSIVSRSYLATGFCLIYLVIGDSLYFFGRSNENRLLFLSSILLPLFFLLLDLAGQFLAHAPGKPTKPFIHRNMAPIVSIAFVTSIIIWYGDRIIARAAIQANNAGMGQFVYPSEISKQSVMRDIADIKSVTGDNPKVYFVGRYNFLYYYYGGYAPIGYYNPWHTWGSKRELNKFLQGLVDQGYYLVIDPDEGENGISSVKLSNYILVGRRLVAWK